MIQPEAKGPDAEVLRVRDPRSILGLGELLIAQAPGLLWSLGLVERWGELGGEIARRWRFYVLGGEVGEGCKTPKALLMGDPGGLGWWGVAAGTYADALTLTREASEFPQARSITGSPDIIQALIEATPALAGPWAVKRSLALSRKRQVGEGQGPGPIGVGRARLGDIPSLMRFDPGHPGEGEAQVRRVLGARIRRGEVFVLRSEGQLLGMGEAIFAGCFRDVERVKILEAYRGRGLGRLLMMGIIHEAGRTGHDLCLCVERGNLIARRLYASLGFASPWQRGDWTR